MFRVEFLLVTWAANSFLYTACQGSVYMLQDRVSGSCYQRSRTAIIFSFEQCFQKFDFSSQQSSSLLSYCDSCCFFLVVIMEVCSPLKKRLLITVYTCLLVGMFQCSFMSILLWKYSIPEEEFSWFKSRCFSFYSLLVQCINSPPLNVSF